MGILQQWRDKAYNEKANKGDLQRMWADYFAKEKSIYAEILKNPDEVVTGTVSELAEKFDVDLMTMTGFLDGINDSLKEPNPIEEMDENTVVNLGFDKELLYKNMVAAGADWLYDLEEWEPIFDEEKSSTRKREKNCTRSRRRAVLSESPPRSIPTIPAPADPAKNTKSATAETADPESIKKEKKAVADAAAFLLF